VEYENKKNEGGKKRKTLGLLSKIKNKNQQKAKKQGKRRLKVQGRALRPKGGDKDWGRKMTSSQGTRKNMKDRKGEGHGGGGQKEGFGTKSKRGKKTTAENRRLWVKTESNKNPNSSAKGRMGQASKRVREPARTNLVLLL